MPSFRLAAVGVPLWPWLRDDQQTDTELSEERPAVKPSELALRDFRGQAYCFLPLSLKTGLPVHISANFALTANRRDLWRRSDDQQSSESNLRASWNEALLEKMCPRAYADALELLAAGLLQSAPTQGKLPFKADNFLPTEASLELQDVWRHCRIWALWPRASSSHFAEIPARVSQELVARDAAVFHGEGEASGVPVFHRAKSSLLCSSKRFNELKPELRSSIGRLCIAGRKRSPVQVPADICEILEVKGTTWLEPQSLATMLRGFNTKSITFAEADALVDYILSPEGKGSLQHGRNEEFDGPRKCT